MKYRLVGYRGRLPVDVDGAADTESEALRMAQMFAKQKGIEVLVQHDRPSGRPGWMHVFTVDSQGTQERFQNSGIACDLLAAIKQAFEAGADDVWDDPRFEDARMLTRYAQASWDFDGWKPIYDDLLIHGKVTIGGTVFA